MKWGLLTVRWPWQEDAALRQDFFQVVGGASGNHCPDKREGIRVEVGGANETVQHRNGEGRPTREWLSKVQLRLGVYNNTFIT